MVILEVGIGGYTLKYTNGWFGSGEINLEARF
jgi:hypothetical protein